MTVEIKAPAFPESVADGVVSVGTSNPERPSHETNCW